MTETSGNEDIHNKPDATQSNAGSINEQEMDEFLAALASETAEEAKTDVPAEQVASVAAKEESSGSENEDSSSSDSDIDTSSDESSDDERVELQDGDEFDKEDDDWIPRTRNEIIEEEIAPLPPNFEMKPDTPIEAAGKIGSFCADGTVIVEAAASGKYRILNEGVVFCLGDRRILGALSETFGPIEKPFYVLRLKPETLKSLELANGQEVFYVVSTSQFVLTETFKVKGSDASNFNDEEVPLEEQEFSDDEEEVMSKQAIKRKRKRRQQENEKTEGAPQKITKTQAGPQHRPYPGQRPNQYNPPAHSAGIFGQGQFGRVRQPQPPQSQNQFGRMQNNQGQFGRMQHQGQSLQGQTPQGQQPQGQQPQNQQPQNQQGLLAAWYSYAQRFFGQGNAAPPY